MAIAIIALDGTWPPWGGLASVVGCVLLLVVLGAWFRGALGADEVALGVWIPGALGLAFSSLGAAALLHGSLDPDPGVVFFASVERGGPRLLSLPVLLLGVASLLTPSPADGRAWTRVRGGLQALCVGTGLALIVGGLLFPGRPVPMFLVGVVGTLLVLLALDGLALSIVPARVTAACVLAGLFALGFAQRPSRGVLEPPEQDELVGFSRLPPAWNTIEGWVAEAVPATSVRAAFQFLPSRPGARPITEMAPLAPAAGGRRTFRLSVPDRLAPGTWRARVEFLRQRDAGPPEILGKRSAGTFRVPHSLRVWLRWIVAVHLISGFLFFRSRRRFALFLLGNVTLLLVVA